jgi:hypothetical protein
MLLNQDFAKRLFQHSGLDLLLSSLNKTDGE